MNILINKASNPADMQKCFDIRLKVFVHEQNVPLEEEIDDNDAVSDHYLLHVANAPAGTARVRIIDDYAKIERVAVLEEHQGKGLGKELLLRILTYLKQKNAVKKAKLSSQVYAIPFYEKLGFLVCSEVYMDANIPHKDMVLNVL